MTHNIRCDINNIRIWFKDGNYLDTVYQDLHFYECDPEFDRWVELHIAGVELIEEEEVRQLENGK